MTVSLFDDAPEPDLIDHPSNLWAIGAYVLLAMFLAFGGWRIGRHSAKELELAKTTIDGLQTEVRCVEGFRRYAIKQRQVAVEQREQLAKKVLELERSLLTANRYSEELESALKGEIVRARSKGDTE